MLVFCGCVEVIGFWGPSWGSWGHLWRTKGKSLGRSWSCADVGLCGGPRAFGTQLGVLGDPTTDIWVDVGLLWMWVFGGQRVFGTQLGVLGASLENQGQIFGEKLVFCRCGSLWRSTGFWDPAVGLGRPSSRYLGGCWSAVDVGVWRSTGFGDAAGDLRSCGGIFGEPSAGLGGDAGVLWMWVFGGPWNSGSQLGVLGASLETLEQITWRMLVFCSCGSLEVHEVFGTQLGGCRGLRGLWRTSRRSLGDVGACGARAGSSDGGRAPIKGDQRMSTPVRGGGVAPHKWTLGACRHQ